MTAHEVLPPIDHYALIAEEIEPFKIGGRTDSAALLAWFLANVWRLEPSEVEDAICDGPGDKGLDALVVNDDTREITVFQTKHRQNASVTQGDGDLKNLVGAAIYFESPESVDSLIDSKPNAEVLKLLARTEVREKLETGDYTVGLVFVTNAPPDASATDYMTVAEDAGHRIDLWDRDRIGEVAARTRRPDLRPEVVKLKAAGPVNVVSLTDDEQIAVALVSAEQLIKLPGISDLSLFDRNVRLSAGKTPINKELATTIQDESEHSLFAAYHNGMTLLTDEVTARGKTLTLTGVGVVNGCQSLLALSENHADLTSDLLVLIKVVSIAPGSGVADLITRRSNNQNAVNLRDQRSTDPTMRDLQGQVRAKYGNTFDLLIRVGEPTTASATMDNALAAQLIMAVYLQEPWAAVRRVRLFDDEFRRIFSQNIDADKLYLLHLIDNVVVSKKSLLSPELNAAFASIRFTLAGLVASVLRLSEDGNTLLDAPSSFLPAHTDSVRSQIADIAEDVIANAAFYVEQSSEDDETFDPKVAFKSKTGVKALEHEVTRDGKRQAKKDENYLFAAPTE